VRRAAGANDVVEHAAEVRGELHAAFVVRPSRAGRHEHAASSSNGSWPERGVVRHGRARSAERRSIRPGSSRGCPTRSTPAPRRPCSSWITSALTRPRASTKRSRPEARRVARRFEFRHTPRQGSWLDVAEIFLSTMSIECLEQRVQDAPTLRTLVDAWMRSRKSGKVRWRSRAEDARIKPHPLYPSLPEIRGTSRNGAMTSQMDATASPKSRRKLAFVLR